MMHNLISLTVWTPIVAGIVVLFAGKNDCLARMLALIGAVIGLLFSARIFVDFNPHQS